MATPIVRGNYEQLSRVAQTFSRQAETCQQTLRSVQQVKNVLQNGDWVGQGAAAFYSEMDSALLPALTRLINALEVASTVTLTISQIVNQTEVDVARLFQSNPTPTPVPAPTPTPLPPTITPHSQSSINWVSIGTHNGCGLVSLSAAAEALKLQTFDDSLNKIAGAVPEGNKYGYGVHSGIQPLEYAQLARDTFPNANIETPDYRDKPSEALNRIRQELANGNQVIVDYLSIDQYTAKPVADSETEHATDSFAHFARVVGFTPDGEKIILAQSLHSEVDKTHPEKQINSPTIEVSISEFLPAWHDPEDRAKFDIKHPTETEDIDNWMMIVSPKGQP